MRKLYLLSVLILFVSLGKAQGNLQFNQVITYSLTSGTPQAFTVPAGKAWKVETAGISLSGSSAIYLRNGAGTQISCLVQNNSSGYPYYNTVFPLWLNENFQGQFYAAGCTGIISIIEFNIVP